MTAKKSKKQTPSIEACIVDVINTYLNSEEFKKNIRVILKEIVTDEMKQKVQPSINEWFNKVDADIIKRVDFQMGNFIKKDDIKKLIG